MTLFDPKANLISMISRSYDFLVKDLKAIPEEKQNVIFGGCTRTALDMAAECAATNQNMALRLAGTPKPALSAEENASNRAKFDTQDKALAYLEETTTHLKDVILAMDPDTFCDNDPEFFNGAMSRYSMAELTGIHMMYHTGQLNYIQMLLGDDKVHWW